MEITLLIFINMGKSIAAKSKDCNRGSIHDQVNVENHAKLNIKEEFQVTNMSTEANSSCSLMHTDRQNGSEVIYFVTSTEVKKELESDEEAVHEYPSTVFIKTEIKSEEPYDGEEKEKPSNHQSMAKKASNEIKSDVSTASNCPDRQDVSDLSFYSSDIKSERASFSCSFCTFTSMYRMNVRCHELIHTREKAFACSLCPYRGSRKYHLEVHMKRHSSEKRFACKSCSYKAVMKSEMNAHNLSHIGAQHFACHMCAHKTYTKTELNSHLLTHPEYLPYACQLCTYRSCYRSDFKAHMDNHKLRNQRNQRLAAAVGLNGGVVSDIVGTTGESVVNR